MVNEHEYLLSSEWKNGIDYKPIVYDLIEDFMYFCMLYPVLILLFSKLDSGNGHYLSGFTTLAAFVLMTIIRRKVKKLYAYAGLLTALVILFALIPFPLPVRLSIMTCVIVAAMISVKKVVDSVKRAQLKTDPTVLVNNTLFAGYRTLFAGAGVFYLTWMISLALKVDLLALCLTAITVFLACFGIYIHFTGTYSLIGWKKNKNYSFWKIRNFNWLFLFTSAAVVAVISFLSYNIVYFTGLYKIDLSILAALTHLPDNSGKTSAPKNSDTSNGPSIYDELLKIKHTKPSLLSQIINQVLTVLLWTLLAVVVLIIVIAVIRIIFNFFKNLRGSINEETKTVFSIKEAAADFAEKARKTSILSFFSDSSERMKIRRIYYRLIKKYQTKGVLVSNSDSPSEIGSKVRNKSGRDIHEATLIYEKARYSHDDCSKSDLDRLKNSLKHEHS